MVNSLKPKDFASNNSLNSAIVGVHKVMLDSGKEGSVFSMVESHLPHIIRLLEQPYFLDAIKRGVEVKILYTGPSAQEREKMIDDAWLCVLNERGPEGLTTHLQKAPYFGDNPLNEKEARRLAYGFNACIEAGLKPGDRVIPASILEQFYKS